MPKCQSGIFSEHLFVRSILEDCFCRVSLNILSKNKRFSKKKLARLKEDSNFLRKR